MLLDGAFTVLLLIICGVSSDAVPPPSNITVRCQNLQTTVSWDYSKHQPQTVFWVNITGPRLARPFGVNTTEHQYDLSHFVLDSKEHYLTYLIVSVTAVQGGKQSEAVLSQSFSYDQLEAVDIKCTLDFPPVVVREAEKGSSVEFKNPLHFYKELKRTVKLNSNTFLSYTVSSAANNSEKFKGTCSVKDSTCKLDITFPDDEEKCITLDGVLMFNDLGVDQVPFQETKKICSEKHALDGEVVLAITLGSIFLVVLILAVAIICKVEAWTTKTPVPLIRVDPCRNGEQQCFIPPVNPENNQVSVSPPYESPSLDSEGDKCPARPQASNASGDYDCRPREYDVERGCLEGSNPNLETEDLTSGANGMDDDSAESTKTECLSLSSTEEERSPYDCPHVQVDLGNGELLNGYTGN